MSVVITNHDHERYLADCIASALAQSYARVEVVVVDDGSTDGSRRVLDRFRDAVTVVLKQNGGQASAVNAGFAACSGDIVLFLDSDDLLLPEAAEALVRAWAPELSKVQFPLRVMGSGSGEDPAGEPRDRMVPEGPLPSGDVAPLVLTAAAYPAPPMSGNATARWALDRLLPMPEADWRISADSYLMLLVPLLGPIRSLSQPLGCYRLHPGNHWAGRGPELARLRSQLELDRRNDAALAAFAAESSLRASPGAVLRTAEHLQARLASLRLDPAGHPFPGDGRGRLALSGMRAAWGHPFYRRRKRIAFSFWFALVALLPGGLAQRVIRAGYVREGRTRLLQKAVA